MSEEWISVYTKGDSADCTVGKRFLNEVRKQFVDLGYTVDYLSYKERVQPPRSWWSSWFWPKPRAVFDLLFKVTKNEKVFNSSVPMEWGVLHGFGLIEDWMSVNFHLSNK